MEVQFALIKKNKFATYNNEKCEVSKTFELLLVVLKRGCNSSFLFLRWLLSTEDRNFMHWTTSTVLFYLPLSCNVTVTGTVRFSVTWSLHRLELSPLFVNYFSQKTIVCEFPVIILQNEYFEHCVKYRLNLVANKVWYICNQV